MDHSEHMKEILDSFLGLVKEERIPIFIPVRMGLRKMITNHVFHDYGEIFLQVEGKTLFHFPTESLELSAGELRG